MNKERNPRFSNLMRYVSFVLVLLGLFGFMFILQYSRVLAGLAALSMFSGMMLMSGTLSSKSFRNHMTSGLYMPIILTVFGFVIFPAFIERGLGFKEWVLYPILALWVLWFFSALIMFCGDRLANVLEQIWLVRFAHKTEV